MTTVTRWLHSLQDYDLRMLLWFIHRQHRELWITFSRALSHSGDGTLQLLLPSLFWVIDGETGMQLFIATALVFLIERPIYWCLKNGCQRRRPPEAIPSFQSVVTASDRFSFPSGHTCAAFALATLVTLHYGAVAAPLYLWATGVGLSRVVLGVHFPTDTLAGAALGTFIAWSSSTYLLIYLF